MQVQPADILQTSVRVDENGDITPRGGPFQGVTFEAPGFFGDVWRAGADELHPSIPVQLALRDRDAAERIMPNINDLSRFQSIIKSKFDGSGDAPSTSGALIPNPFAEVRQFIEGTQNRALIGLGIVAAVGIGAAYFGVPQAGIRAISGLGRDLIKVGASLIPRVAVG